MGWWLRGEQLWERLPWLRMGCSSGDLGLTRCVPETHAFHQGPVTGKQERAEVPVGGRGPGERLGEMMDGRTGWREHLPGVIASWP